MTRKPDDGSQQAPERIETAEQLAEVERALIKLKRTMRRIALKIDTLRALAKDYRNRSRA
jgi:hypothetical protein